MKVSCIMCHMFKRPVCELDTALINKGSCSFMALMVTEYDWKFPGATHIIRHMTYIHHLQGFEFQLGRFRLRKVRSILTICLSNTDFSRELHIRSRYVGSEAVGVRRWGYGGRWWGSVVHSVSCPGPSPAGRACLLTAEWHHQGGPLSPLFGREHWNSAHKGCTALLSPDLSGRSTFENP